MYRRILGSILLVFCFPWHLLAQEGGEETHVFSSIVKIKTYERDPLLQSFEFSHFGSAVLIGKNRILTNAHVIQGRDTNAPTGYYEICISSSFRTIPYCTTEARLISYDDILDIALLELRDALHIPPVSIDPTIDGVKMGQDVIMYGYPMIGGDTITRTEGKVAGFMNGVYKIDGSIDHGNSGGGAFDRSLRLIGMPFAVSSDNGVIGYIIPIDSIAKFLDKKSEWYTSLKSSWDQEFLAFMQQVHRSKNGGRLPSRGMITFPNLESYGLVLRDNFTLLHESIYGWVFSNVNNRVRVYVSCSKDAGKVTGVEIERSLIESGFHRSWIRSAVYTGSSQEFYLIEKEQKSVDDSASPAFIWYYTHYDGCMAEIYPTDALTDTKTLQNVFSFLEKIRFPKMYTLLQSQRNPFFEISQIGSGARVSYYVDGYGLPQVQLQFQFPNKNRIAQTIEHGSFSDREDYFLRPFEDVEVYTGSLDIEHLANQFRLHIEQSETLVRTAKNGKKFIVSYLLNPAWNATVNVYYPYQLGTQYAYWYWSASAKKVTISDIETIISFFDTLQLPGISPFISQ